MGAFKGWQSVRRNPLFANFPDNPMSSDEYAYSFPGAFLNLDASQKVSTSTNNTLLSFWIDIINNVIFTQSDSALQPTYLTSDPAFNNNPVVHFTSTARLLSSLTGFSLPSDFTFVLVALCSSSGGTNNVAIGNGIANAAGLFNFRRGSTFGISVMNGGTAVMDSGVIDGAAHISIFNKNSIVVDGVKKVSGSFIPSIVYSQINQLSTGKYAQIIAYRKTFTDAENIVLSDLINSRFNIY
jgi:hypothetical protein